MRPTETVTFEDDSIIFTRKHDVEALLQGIKERSEITSKYHVGPVGSKWIGSLDTITAANWSKECGAAIGTKEFAAYAKKKLMDPDYSKFRANLN